MQHEQYAAHALFEDRHWWFTARRAILRALIGAGAAPGSGAALVDIGCGTGGNVAALAGEYAVLGLDPSADAIGFARTRFPAVHFIQTDDPESGRAHLAGGGVVLMTDVLEHVADDRTLLARAISIVPAGGHLVLTVPADPTLWSRHDTQYGHYRRYSSEEFRALWRDAPVEERLLSPFNSRLRPVIATIRRFTRDNGSDFQIPAGPLNAMLRRIFAGEAAALVQAIDSGRPAFTRGVSLAAVLRRR
ncbi:MAG: class I SAM-dependent methyltransferase [Gemmatimonadales bacterium]